MSIIGIILTLNYEEVEETKRQINSANSGRGIDSRGANSRKENINTNHIKEALQYRSMPDLGK